MRRRQAAVAGSLEAALYGGATPAVAGYGVDGLVQERGDAAMTDATALRCTYCLKGQHEAANLIAGPMVYICSECIAAAAKLLATGAVSDATMKRVVAGTACACSFCGRSRSSVKTMLTAATQGRMNICNECVGLCQDIVAEEIAHEQD